CRARRRTAARRRPRPGRPGRTGWGSSRVCLLGRVFRPGRRQIGPGDARSARAIALDVPGDRPLRRVPAPVAGAHGVAEVPAEVGGEALQAVDARLDPGGDRLAEPLVGVARGPAPAPADAGAP